MSKYHKLAWDDEAKQRARDEINKRKPWLKSTGAKTLRGKESSKMNALKNNYTLHSLLKELNSLVKKRKYAQRTLNN